jgi:LYR motif-containing protein 4
MEAVIDMLLPPRYILRRAREDFRLNAQEANPEKLQQLLKGANEDLEVVKRQSVVYQLYGRKIKNVLVRP